MNAVVPRSPGRQPVQDVSAAAIYLTAKLSFHPASPRAVLNVYAMLGSPASALKQEEPSRHRTPSPDDYYLSDGSYQSAKITLFQTETTILRALSFSLQIVSPHHLAMTYLQTLGVLPPRPTEQSRSVALRTLAYLNTALLSPQLLYLTHQPSALAVAAIYLAAREVGATLSSVEWWEVFDVDREELGFLSVGLLSCEEWIREEEERWKDRARPITVVELDRELKRLNQDPS